MYFIFILQLLKDCAHELNIFLKTVNDCSGLFIYIIFILHPLLINKCLQQKHKQVLLWQLLSFVISIPVFISIYISSTPYVPHGISEIVGQTKMSHRILEYLNRVSKRNHNWLGIYEKAEYSIYFSP